MRNLGCRDLKSFIPPSPFCQQGPDCSRTRFVRRLAIRWVRSLTPRLTEPSPPDALRRKRVGTPATMRPNWAPQKDKDLDHLRREIQWWLVVQG